MKLSIVIPVLGQHELATFAIQKLLENISDPNTDIVVIDNGRDYTFPFPSEKVKVIRPEKNIGVYPAFKFGFDFIDSDILAFFHSDLIVDEKSFDVRIVREFIADSRLGLVGFVGSDEIDFNGGRGGGTTSFFQGNKYEDGKNVWIGSPAEAHGRRNSGTTPAAVVDGCAMIIRRTAWEKFGARADFPPHHFYDRLISTQMLEAGFGVAVMGIACDHISGQTVSKETRYGDMAKEWCEVRDISMTHNWDDAVYKEAEKMWLEEYRDRKHLIPIMV